MDKLQADSFNYRGLYRVQSRRSQVHSEIAGSWIGDNNDILSSSTVNRSLENSPLWMGKARVALRAANVVRRTGLFESDPDILVKKQFFIPDEGSDAMANDFVDVFKSIHYWRIREPYRHALFGKREAGSLDARISDLEATIANEYFCHEAGHMVGYDVRSKYDDSYFRINGNAAWPLIFVEEFRSDLHGFGFAKDLLPPELAVQVFIYNLLLRFGLEAEAFVTGSNAYGAVPYLLFHFLIRNGFILVTTGSEKRGRLCIVDSSDSAILEMMSACATHATQELTKVELEMHDHVDAAMSAASYFRERITDEATMDTYETVLNAAAHSFPISA